MKLTFLACNDLPKLAWLATANLREKQVEVVHGPYVECRDSFFIEGAWNGDFAEGDFADSNCIFGTGAVLHGEAVVFVTSAATTDYLYWHQGESVVTVSNSLAFLLAELNDELNPHFMHYPEIHDSTTKGIFHYVKTLPTVKGSVNRLMYQNLRVTPDSVAEVEKQATPSFSCFREYHDFLKTNYAQIARNARDPRRSQPLDIYSTQSRGYDTTAVNALARDYGIDKVFTVTKAKGKGAYADKDKAREGDDDGSEICSVLGLKSVQIDRRAFERGFPEEYLFYSALNGMQDANFLDITRQIPGACLLLTGILGELWYPETTPLAHTGTINDRLVRWGLGGHGLSEVRLNAGFVQLPIPYIGARSRPDIVRITDSKEMDPWRLNTSYDRPIARRIAEDAGVPRDFFGQVKLASVTELPNPSVPCGVQLKHEFFEFLVSQRILRRWQIRLFPLIRRINTWITFRCEHKPVYYFEALIFKITGRNVSIPLLWRKLDGSLYCYCVNKRAGDYSLWLHQVHRNSQ